MKTIVFALQVFGMMALLPLCVILEMKHGTSTAYTVEAKTAVDEKTANTSIDFSSVDSAYPIAAITLKRVNGKTKKKGGSACCNCKNCECGSSCKCSDL